MYHESVYSRYVGDETHGTVTPKGDERMAFTRNVSVGDIYEMRMIGRFENQATITLQHLRVMTVDPAVDTITLQGAIGANAIAVGGTARDLLNVLPSDWTADRIETQRVAPKTQRTVTVTTLWAGPGQRGASNTANLAQVVTRRTSFSGRSQVSDVHLPVSTAVADIVDGVLSAGQKAALEAWAPHLYGNLVLLGGTCTLAPVIYHRKVDPLVQSNWDEITSYIVQSTVRTMRRRNIGVGI